MNKKQIIFFKSLIFIIIVSFLGFSSVFGFQRIITFGLLPGVLFFTFQSSRFSLDSVNNYYLNVFFILILWSLLMLFVAKLPDASIKEISKLIGVFASMLVIYQVIKLNPSVFIPWIFKCFVIGYYVIVIIMYQKTGFTSEINAKWIDRSTETLGQNANMYSYAGYFATLSVFYLHQLTQRKYFVLLSIATSILMAYISFYTASRSGLLFLLLLNVAYWIFIYGSMSKYPVIKYFIVLISLLVGLNILFNFYEGSFLNTRVENSLNSGDSRETLAMGAVEVFMDHPFTGVGPGNYFFYSMNNQSFSHNSFTEIAANLGFIGLILIVLLFVRPFVTSINLFGSNFHPFKGSINKLNFVFFGTFILYNNFYVFYLTTFGMMFFILIIMIQKYFR